MDSMQSLTMYARPAIGGLIAIVLVYFLIKFVVRQVFFMFKVLLFLALAGVAFYFYLEFTGYFGPSKGGRVSVGIEAEQSTEQLLYEQIVDVDEPDKFSERAILEGHPFKYLLKRVSKTNYADLLKEAQANERTTFENLTDEPDLHRGEAYTTGRGVIIEVSTADLTKEYELDGWTVLPGIYINSSHQIFALRIACPPGSKTYDRLKKGITEDKLPVVNLVGVFFKNYARQPADVKEDPKSAPLLVCVEPEFIEKEEPRQVMQELKDTGNARYLPTQRIEAPAAEERLVIELPLLKDAKPRAWGETAGADLNGFVAAAIQKLKQRLPAAQAANAAAVVVIKGDLSKDPSAKATVLQPLLDALKAAHVTRVSVKQGPATPLTATPGK